SRVCPSAARARSGQRRGLALPRWCAAPELGHGSGCLLLTSRVGLACGGTEAEHNASLPPMSTVIDNLEKRALKQRPKFGAGDRVRVHFQVVEGNRRRTQVFEGIVIKRQGSGARETFTVRKQSFGVGVERTFPLHSPKIERLEVAARGDVRR